MAEDRLTHVDETGAARMVDVGDKATTTRIARAGARVWMAPETMKLLLAQALPKGDVLPVARIAGIMAAKKTAELVPLCHPLPISHIDVSFTVVPEDNRIDIECVARTEARTGVEMEAITGASMAAVTIYDMCKAVDREMIIGDIRLLEKSGGRSGHYRRQEEGSAASGSDAAAGSNTAPSGDAGAPGAGSQGKVTSVNISPGKGERKKPVEKVLLVPDHGVQDDGHAGPWHRQVSLLAQESIDRMVAKGLNVKAGDFAENITTLGLDICKLPIGTQLRVGSALVELTQIGKVCHERCAIYYQAGDCIMPREGIFARVIEGAEVSAGDTVTVVKMGDPAATPPEGAPRRRGRGAGSKGSKAAGGE